MDLAGAPILPYTEVMLTMCPKSCAIIPEHTSVGTVLAQCWQRVGTVLAQCWHRVGTVLAQCWHRVGTVLAQCWHRVGTVLIQCWNSVGTALAQCWDSDLLTWQQVSSQCSGRVKVELHHRPVRLLIHIQNVASLRHSYTHGQCIHEKFMTTDTLKIMYIHRTLQS